MQKKQKIKTYIGKISTSARGFGFFSNEKLEEDIKIESQDLNTAIHGDEVEIEIFKTRFGQRGAVVKILKRIKKDFVGIITRENNKFEIKPDDRHAYFTITIKNSGLKSEDIGKKALARIGNFKQGDLNPEGKILQVLGKSGDHETEIQSIILEKGIDNTFPEEVLKESETVYNKEKNITIEEIAKRKDFRNTTTFTIDPYNAKDFDDAISMKDLGNETYEIGVHIADVSHYVKEKTALDDEAQERSFSVYLVDRTIPMLPEELSNDICSLKPNEDRLAFSAVFEMNKRGEISKRWFGKTIINSNKRFSYEEAQEVLNNKAGIFYTELNTLNEIAKKMRVEKERNGAIDFEQDEISFVLDDKNVPVKIIKKERLDTHKMVEEYMLLANKEVAEYVYNKLGKEKGKIGQFIYRIHDLPNSEKIQDLAAFVKALGHELPVKKHGITQKDLQELFKKISGEAEEAMIKTAAIRSMAKAIYSTKNIGHFGLAFEYYTHFTSPIRRYSDLLVHRMLFDFLQGKNIVREVNLYERITKHITEKEISAAEAERESKKYKQVEYMSVRIGQTFDATISGITDWGIYVEEKETRSEGLIRISQLGNEYFKVDSKNYCLIGEKTKKKYSLGDKVRIKLKATDLEKKTIDFEIV